MRAYAGSVGVSCYAQELIPWGSDERLSDGFSLLTRPGTAWDREHRVLANPSFMDEARKLAELRGLYGAISPTSHA